MYVWCARLSTRCVFQKVFPPSGDGQQVGASATGPEVNGLPAPKLESDKAFFEEVLQFPVSGDGTSAVAFDKFLASNVALDDDTGVVENQQHDEAKVRAATTGEFGTRSCVGQRFVRVHKKGTKKALEYLACSNRAEKAKFRADWAKAEYSDYARSGKKETKAWQDIDEEIGEHKTFGAIVQSFGGFEWQPAINGAKRYAATCARLGNPWMVVDEMSGLQMYLVLKRVYKHVITQKWQLYEDHWNMVGGGGGGGGHPGGGGNGAAATALSISRIRLPIVVVVGPSETRKHVSTPPDPSERPRVRTNKGSAKHKLPQPSMCLHKSGI